MKVTIRSRPGRKGFQVRARGKSYQFEKTVPTREQAEKLAEQQWTFHRSRELRNFGPSPTVPNACWRWIDLHRANLKPYWVKNAESIIRNHIEPYLGAVMLRDLDEERLRAYVAQRLQEDGSRYVLRNALKIIARAARTAPSGTRPLEPLPKVGDLVRIPRAPKPYWSPEELEVLLAAAESEGLETYALFRVLADTAVRRGEAMGIQWEHVDYQGEEIELWRAIVDDQVVPLKDDDPRRVPMVPELAEVFRELHNLRRRQGMERGWKDVPPWVFCRRDGSHLRIADVEPVWRRIRRTAQKGGVRPYKLHAFRHSWATHALAAGETIAYVAAVLGHGNPGYTLATYAHAVPRDARDLSWLRERYGSRSEGKRRVQNAKKKQL